MARGSEVMAIAERLYSPNEVAKFLGVQRQWVIVRIKRGEIGAYRVGAYWRISEFELRRFLNRNRSSKGDDESSSVSTRIFFDAGASGAPRRP